MPGYRFILAAALFVFAASCGGGDATTPSVSVASVTLSQNAATLTPQQTVNLVATPKDASGNALSGRTIAWSSNASAVATVIAGQVTAVTVGTALITATSEGKSASATITVAALVVPVATVTLNQSSASLVPLQPVTLVATTKDASGNTLTGRGVTWGSSATAVVTVDGNGVVNAVTPGSATITATSEGKSATANITVGNGGFVGATGGTASAFSGNAVVTVPAGALAAGTAITIAQVANPQADPKLAPGTAYDFGPAGTTFTSPVTLAIKYDPALLAAGTIQSQLRIHRLVGTTWTPLPGSTVNTGTRVVTATTSSFSIYAALEVPVPIAAITISPNPVDLPLGMQVQLTGVAKDAQGNTMPGKVITWASSVPGVATISTTTGLVTSAAIGATVITATSEGFSSPMPLNVRGDASARTLSVYQGGGIFSIPGNGTIITLGGFTTACAIGVNQNGYCWGDGASGAVGDGSQLDRAIPTPISLGAPLAAITVGQSFGCGLTVSRAVWCWGRNVFGAFGNGSQSGSLTPVQAFGGQQYIDIDAGDEHMCGIALSGGTFCAGRNDFGSLGIGFMSTPIFNATGITTPTRVVGDPGFVSISVGGYAACGLTANGTAYCWGAFSSAAGGSPDLTATPVPSAPAFRSISHGATHRCGIAMDRRAYCWGDNFFGQIGDGSKINRTAPVLVSGGLLWRSISAGVWYTCGITTDSRTFCWGGSSAVPNQGELGISTITGSTTPVQVNAGAPPLAVVKAGMQTTCGLAVDGTGYCWGFRGALGNGEFRYSSAPTQVLGATSAVDVSRGSPMACYTNNVQRLFCWGEREEQTSPQQLAIFGTTSVNTIAVRNFGPSCLILASDSHISCWGTNGAGGVGNNTTVIATTPTPINSVRAFNSIATLNSAACGVSTLSELLCWGSKFPQDVFNPTQFGTGTTWTSVWGGIGTDICAISNVSVASCGPIFGTLTPIAGQWSMMALGNGAAFNSLTKCGLNLQGDPFCMGDNSLGQIGDGTNVNRAAMTPVSGGRRFVQIIMARSTVCGVTALPAGDVYCWGDGTLGQFGSAPGVSSNVPVLVPGGRHFTRISAGGHGICGVTTDGSVYCWGLRDSSALGNGETDDRRTPEPMTGGIRFLLYEPGTAGMRIK